MASAKWLANDDRLPRSRQGRCVSAGASGRGVDRLAVAHRVVQVLRHAGGAAAAIRPGAIYRERGHRRLCEHADRANRRSLAATEAAQVLDAWVSSASRVLTHWGIAEGFQLGCALSMIHVVSRELRRHLVGDGPPIVGPLARSGEMAYNACDGRPAELARAVLCLDELSKDVNGDLVIIDADVHECREL